MHELRIPSYQIHLGNNLDILKSIPDESIDSIVTDPPYEIAFMGKGWDNTGAAYNQELWAECLRVLKAGGHLIAFGATRTIHRTTCAIEDAGFEIRDMISWLYFSGFPKSLNIAKAIDSTLLNGGSHSTKLRKTELEYGTNSYQHKGRNNGILGDVVEYERKEIETQTEEAKEFEGWGTALKPAQEPAILARKPLAESSIARQVLKTKTGGLNIDACRFGYGDECWVGPDEKIRDPRRKDGSLSTGTGISVQLPEMTYCNSFAHHLGRWPANIYQCAKPSRAERDAGLEHLADKIKRSNMNSHNGTGERLDGNKTPEVKNFHPTVKPLKLMRWLCRLVTPKGGTVLDPFAGSGTTLAAAVLEGFDSIGCELTEDYIPIIEGRCSWAIEEYKRENAQLSFFDWLGEA